MSVEFGDKSVGQQGANIFYKEFSVSYDSNWKTYRLGSFYFVCKPPNPVTIAEFQLIWKNTYNGKKYASVKLYFDPEDDDDEDDEECEFGKDEVIEADRQVVIECAVFPFWECSPKLWNKNIGEIAFADIPPGYLKNVMRESTISTDENFDVKIISYPQYCRFQTCKKLIKIGVPMTSRVFMARGGIILKNINTLILFSRWRFSKRRIDEFSLTRNITVPVFRGRPPKKKRKEFMLLKKKKQARLMKELKKWKGLKRNYEKRPNMDKNNQDGQSSASSAASRILKKYKKKNEQTESVIKKEDETKSLKELKKKAALQNHEGEEELRKAIEAANKTIKETGKNEKAGAIVEDKVNTEDTNGKDTIIEMRPIFDDILPREEFIKELYAFMEKKKRPILKIPSMGHAQVDFYDLFTLVVKYGGYALVTAKRQWRDVYDGLGRHSHDITNIATSVRKVYENCLLLYENKIRKDVPVEVKRENAAGYTEECKKEETNNEPSKTSLPSDESNKKIKLKSQPNVVKNKAVKPAGVYKKKEKRKNLPVPITYVSCENNSLQKDTNGDLLPKPAGTPTAANSGTTSITLQAGEAFKLMIQKRRGRPSNDFRKQIEQLKTMNHKVEVEVFSQVGKRTRLPAWLNELNVDIVNPRRRKRKHTAAGEANSKGTRRYITPTVDIAPLPKGEIPRVNNVPRIPYETGSSPSVLKIESPSMCTIDGKSSNGYPEILPKSANGYISMVAMSSEDKVTGHLTTNKNKDNKMCGNLANISLPGKTGRPQTYVQFPSSHPINVPQSVLAYNQYRPKHASNAHSNRVNSETTNYLPRYPARKIVRKEDIPCFINTSDVKIRTPPSANFDGKKFVPNIRQIYFPTEKRLYSSNHRLPNKESNGGVPTEKIYVHHPPHLMATSNGTSNKQVPITRSMTISSPCDPKDTPKSITFPNYIPSSKSYMSPTTTMYRKIRAACKKDGNATVSKSSLENSNAADVDPDPPTVYILPSDGSWVVPRTST